MNKRTAAGPAPGRDSVASSEKWDQETRPALSVLKNQRLILFLELQSPWWGHLEPESPVCALRARQVYAPRMPSFCQLCGYRVSCVCL